MNKIWLCVKYRKKANQETAMFKFVVLKLSAIFIFIFILSIIGCSEPGESNDGTAENEESSGQTAVVAKDLAVIKTKMAMGSPFRIDAQTMSGPIGEPPLDGNIVIQFNSTIVDPKVEDDVLYKLGDNYASGSLSGKNKDKGDTDRFISNRGIYFVVSYTVINETDGYLQPITHIKSSFTLADETGREWLPMTIRDDGFDGSRAFSLQYDLFDPIEFVDKGSQATTVLAFDIASDAKNLRIRSELLGIEIPLDR